MTALLSSRSLEHLARLLAVAVVLEVLLFRIFARGGVYFLDDGTPLAITATYTALVFAGNVLFNFAGPVVLLLIVITAYHLWRARSGNVAPGIAVLVVAVALMSGLMISGVEGAVMSRVYLALSASALAGVAVIAVQSRLGRPIAAFVVMAALSYLIALVFKESSGLAGAGGGTGIQSIPLFGIGEWLAVAGFLPLAMWLRRNADRKSLVVATVVALLALGMAAGRADSVPLIATWAFGLALNLPYPAYVAVLWVVVAFVQSAARRGQILLATGVLLVFLAHRTIPLTYFSDLVLCGMLLVLISAHTLRERKPVTGLSEQIRANLVAAGGSV